VDSPGKIKNAFSIGKEKHPDANRALKERGCTGATQSPLRKAFG